MEMSFRMTYRQELRHEIRLTHAQTIAVDMAQLQWRRDLIEAVHGDKFSPKAVCPACQHPLTDYEIMKGFKDDPRDYTTGCPKCEHRFPPRLHRSTNSGSMEMVFFCPTQTLDRMRNLMDVPLDAFRTKHAEVYNSAVVHFGGLKQAFKKLGLTYAHEADLDWRKRVEPFLGKMADTVIAELVGAPLITVRKLRKERGIKAYSRREEAESLS